ncbi:MAG: ion channel [Acidobacteriota bacterium]
MATAPPPVSPNRDLGIGSRVAQIATGRMLNRDGTFNVSRRGLPFWESISPFHSLITMSWPAYYAVVVVAYLAANFLFASFYFLAGPGALQGGEGAGLHGRFADAFFFSVQTLATIGYGRITPYGMVPNIIATAEALVGLLGVSLATGILFARFSRPTAKILFSERAVVAPFQGGHALMFRVVNGRNNELTNLQATVALAYWETEGEKRLRRFEELTLERQQVMLFPLHWVVVHPIGETSPMRTWTEATALASDVELLIVLTAHDETFAQTVTARTSYKSAEMVWNARFADMFQTQPDGRIGTDVSKLHDIERV